MVFRNRFLRLWEDGRVRHGITLLAVLSLYGALAFWRLDLPGLNGDEARTLSPVLLWGPKGPLGLLLSGYHGPMESFLAYPFYRFLGLTPFMLRLCPLVFSAGTVVACYFLVLILTRRGPVAALAALLLSVSPTFLIASRVGMQKGSLIGFLSTLSLCGFAWWHRGGRRRDFFWGALFLGMALTCRTWFLWYVLALFGTALAFFPQLLVRMRRQAGAVLCGVVVFLSVVLTPFIAANLRPSMKTTEFLERRFGSWEFSYSRNLKSRVREWIMHLDQTAFFNEQADPKTKEDLMARYRNSPHVFLFCLAVGFALFGNRFLSPEIGRTVRLCAGVILLVVLQSALLPRGHRMEHLFILCPLPSILEAAFLGGVFLKKWRWGPVDKLVKISLAAFLLIVGYGDFRILRLYRAYLSRVGGYGEFSPALNELARYAQEAGLREVYFPIQELVMASTIFYLTEGRVAVDYVGSEEQFLIGLRRARSRGEPVAFVKILGWRGPYPLSDLLDRLSSRHSFRRVLFRARDGAPHFELFVFAGDSASP